MIHASPSVDGDIAVFVLTGTWTASSIPDLVEQVDNFCQQHRLTRVLVDARTVDAPLSDFRRHEAGKYIAEHVGSRLRVAVVYREAYFNRMLEYSAVNRGATVHVTSSEDEARDWLLKDGSAGPAAARGASH